MANPFAKRPDPTKPPTYGPQDATSRSTVTPAGIPINVRAGGATINNPFLRQRFSQQGVRLAQDNVMQSRQVMVPGRSYWDNPLRVARYYDAVRAAETEGKQMAGVNHDAIKAIYGYYQQLNGTDDWSRWKAPKDDDPVRYAIGMVPPPPLEGFTQDDLKDFTPAYYQPADNQVLTISKADAQSLGLDLTKYQLDGDNVIVPASEVNRLAGAYVPDEAAKQDMTGGMTAEQYAALPWWKQKIIDATPAESGLLTGALTGLVGGPVGAALGATLGGIFGKASELNPDGTPKYPAALSAMRILNALDVGAEGVERSVGLGVQVVASIQDPETYGPVKEIFDNLPAAWQAAHLFYEAGVPLMQAGKAEIPIEQLTEAQTQYLDVPEEARAAVGVGRYLGNAPIGPTAAGVTALALAEARKRLASGESSEAVYGDITERFGLAAQFRELFGHVVADPLNLVGIGELEAGSAFAKAIKNAPLEAAFKTEGRVIGRGSTLGALQRYGQSLRLLPAEDAAKFGSLSRIIAGVDENGIPTEYNNAQKGRAIQNLFGMTKESKAYTTLVHLTEGLDQSLNTATTPREVEHILQAVENLAPGAAVAELDASNLPRWFGSAEAQPMGTAMKEVGPMARKVIDSYNISAPQRVMMERMAAALSTPERPVAIGEVIRKLGEATDVDTVYRGMMQQVQDNVTRGLVQMNEFKALLAPGASEMGKMARLFSGKDGLPFTFELFKAHISEAIANGIENWAVKYFDIKPMHWANRASMAVKSFQALTLLNVPTFAVNNWLSNIATMAWDGLLPLGVTARGRRAWLKSMGYNVGLLRRGMSAADLGEIGSDLAAAMDIQKGRKAYRLGETLRKAQRGEGAWARADESFQRGVQKLAIFPAISQKFEQSASEIAYFAAMRPYWEAVVWQPGAGFDLMSKEYRQLADYLDAIRPGTSKRIEKLISRGKSRQEIEASIFQGFNAPSIKDVMSPQELELLNAFPGLVDGLDADLKAATTPADVRAAFAKHRERVVSETRKEVTRQARAQVEKVITKAQVEGAAGVMDTFDQVITVRTDALSAHFDRMAEVAAKIEADGLRGNARAAAWQNARKVENDIFRAFEDDEASKWLGLYQGIGANDAETAAMVALLGDGSGDTLGMHSNWRQFFDQMQQDYDNFHSLPDGISRADKAAEWKALNERQNAAYLQALLEEDRIQVKLDDLGGTVYGRKNNHPTARAEWMNWRLDQRNIRRQQAAAMVAFRNGQLPDVMKDWGLPSDVLAKIRKLTRGIPNYLLSFEERPAINKEFYESIYTPFIQQMKQAGQGGPTPEFNPPVKQTTKPKPKQMTIEEEAADIERQRGTGVATQADYEAMKRNLEVRKQAADLWQKVSELKPDLVGVNEAGNFDGAAKLELIKYLRHNNPKAGVVRFADITPQAFEQAVKNEALRTEATRTLFDVIPEESRRPENAALRATIDEELRAAEAAGVPMAATRQAVFMDERGSGAQNLRAFERDLAGMQVRGRTPVVGFLDLRGLGKTNKLFGDPVGDAYIRKLVEAAKETGLELYRKGGDEFLALGTDDATLRGLVDELRLRVERSIIEVNGQEYDGLKFHYGTGADIGAADAAALESLRADPDAERYLGKQYALQPVERASVDPAEGVDMGAPVGAGETRAEVQAVERAAEAAGEAGELSPSPEKIELNSEDIQTARDMDAVLVNDETGQVLTPDEITPAPPDPYANMDPNVLRFMTTSTRRLPPVVRDAVARTAQNMLDEIHVDFRPVIWEKDANGVVIGRHREGGPMWFLNMPEGDRNTNSLRAALRRIITGTEREVDPWASRVKGIIADEVLNPNTNYNREIAWHLGKRDDVFALEGEMIDQIINDPALTQEQVKQKLGPFSDQIIDEWLTRQADKLPESAEAPDVELPEVLPEELTRQAETIADNIDAREAALDVEDSYRFGRDALERELIARYPEEAEELLKLLDTLGENFNPDLQGEELLNKIGWKFGGEFAGEEGAAQIDPAKIKMRIARAEEAMRPYVDQYPGSDSYSVAVNILNKYLTSLEKPDVKQWNAAYELLSALRDDTRDFGEYDLSQTLGLNYRTLQDMYPGREPGFRTEFDLDKLLTQVDEKQKVLGLTRFTEDLRGLVNIFETANVSTVPHEVIHGLTPYMRQADADLVRAWIGDPELPEDWHTAMRYADDGRTLNPLYNDAYEQLSRAFERYLADGAAPTPGLRGLFERMKGWMLKVYQQIAGSEIDVQMSPEVRAMFDRWVGGEEAVLPDGIVIREGRFGGAGKYAAFDETGKMITNYLGTPEEVRAEVNRMRAERANAAATTSKMEDAIKRGLSGQTLTDTDYFTIFGTTREMTLDYLASWLRTETYQTNKRGALKFAKDFLRDRLKGKGHINANGDMVFSLSDSMDAVREYPALATRFENPESPLSITSSGAQVEPAAAEPPPTPDSPASFWDAPEGQATLFGESAAPWQLTAQQAEAQTFNLAATGGQAPLFERGPVQGIEARKVPELTHQPDMFTETPSLFDVPAQVEEAAPAAAQPAPREIVNDPNVNGPYGGWATESQLSFNGPKKPPAFTDIINVNPDDVSYDFIKRAYRGVSMVPEARAARAQYDYVQHMREVIDQFKSLADTPEKQQMLAAELQRYKEGYLRHLNDYMAAKSRVVSTFIAGPSGFPSRQMEKRNETEMRRLNEFVEWSKKAQDSIRKKIAPETSRVISSGDPNAVALLQKKLAGAEKLQNTMIAANKIVRDKKLTDEQKIEQFIALGLDDKHARQLLKPDFTGHTGFPSYATQNNNAEIRRIKARIEEVTRMQSTPASADLLFDGGRIVENKDANRIQIFFDEKPDEATRSKLKARGFRWAPSEGAWQRQFTENAQSVVRYLFPDAKAAEVEAPAVSEDFVVPTIADDTPDPAPQRGGLLFQRNRVPDMPVGTTDEMTGPPTLEASLEGLAGRVLPMLDGAESKLAEQMRQPNRLFDFGNLDPEMNKQLRAYLGKVTMQQMPDAKLATQRWGETKRDFSLLPYHKRYNVDTYLQAIMPYEFWYTRSMINWATRALNKPQIIANYLRMQRFFEENNQRGGYPTRLKKKSMLRLPFLPDWMGEGIYFDPQRAIFPFTQLTMPFERLTQQQNTENKRAESILRQMSEDGEITPAEMEQALASRSGLAWQDALARARQDVERDIQNPLDFAFMLSGPSLPLGIAMKYMQGRQDEISQLPTTRFVQAVTGALGIGGPRGINLEGGIRKAAGLPEIDRFEDYRVDRMLANLAAEGRITADEAQRAMIDRTGPAFEAAQRRVSQTGIITYAGAPLGADLFPEGEQEQRQLQTEYNRAYTAWKNGNKDALTAFFDRYPEYQARMSSFQEPEERLKRFLISEVWDHYTKLPTIYKRQAQDQLGDQFNDAFLNKETRSYDSIDTNTLAMWAQQMGATNPQAAPDIPNMPLSLAPKEEADAVDAFYAEQNARFPGVGEVLRNYYAMPDEQQAAFSYQFPQIDGYYRWKNAYLAAHPDVIPWVIGEDSELAGLPKEILAAVYQFRATRDYKYPQYNRQQDEYFALDKAGRKAYLKAHPELADYWDWRKQAAASNPKAAPYILSESTIQNALLTDYQGNVAPVDYAAIFSEGLLLQLYANRFGKEPMRAGGLGELKAVWESMGRPGGNFDDWVKYEVMPSLTDVQ